MEKMDIWEPMTHNIIICKLIVNKHEKIVFVLTTMMLAYLVENCKDAITTQNARKR
jgi:hypothetical protein